MLSAKESSPELSNFNFEAEFSAGGGAAEGVRRIGFVDRLNFYKSSYLFNRFILFKNSGCFNSLEFK